MKEVVIIDAARTPIGKYKGSLSSVSAVELGKTVVKQIIDRNEINTKDIKQVIFGNVLQAGLGQNPARQIALGAGLSETIPAMTINEVCGSGMKAVILAEQLIQLGKAEIVVAGGVESMTQAPKIKKYLAETNTYDTSTSSMWNDGLKDAFTQEPMGVTAEKVAKQFKISRVAQDEFALKSHLKAAKAQKEGLFAQEILPIRLESGEVIDEDEGISSEMTLDHLETLKPAFEENGTVTAGNSSTINDGAAVLILASKSYAIEQGLPYLATIKDYTEIGIDPSIMGVSPVKAVGQLLENNQLKISDIDLFEINEAFAATSIAVTNELGLPEDKVNTKGGGIALGHPIGASGARVITTLAHSLKAKGKQYGIASLCVGGGLGLALLIECQTETDTQRKFYQLSREERLQKLEDAGTIDRESKNELLYNVALPADIANNLIENQISEISIPLGIAQNFVVNDAEFVIPMATEEPSVIAAASNGARIVKIAGGFRASVSQRLMRGQIVFYDVEDENELRRLIESREAEIFEVARQSYPSIIKRGGGLEKMSIRWLAASQFLSLDLFIDVKDAMGANIVNTILEAVAERLQQELPNEKILFSILSNYSTESLVTATCEIPFSLLNKGEISGKLVAEKIVQASELAKVDPYRAATHNKGIMNGIDAVVLATGNDTRAIAAACHAYAVKEGQYRGLSCWSMKEETLVGTLTVPLAIATVGGATNVLPKAKIALEILKVDSAISLMEVIAALGLAQNLAALKALVTEGIQKGHMSMQSRSLALTVGAIGDEVGKVTALLENQKPLNQEIARAILKKVRLAEK
ncbi:degradative hydroxymethylglutaryl-CoA reductase [Enterococcus rotai]|uniref:hydroxymethylglutaryl-CoA reductase, degradative n=1 Tax=Enterococcus rotai TaxID=118060 RepID=UPI000A628664|nr:hydroxymethylglutaryl-CoA reductase, degradative [Enterococcus rotai]